MIGQFEKAYFHRPIKILHFFTSARIQKCLTQPQNFLSFLTINHLQAESCVWQGVFLHVLPVRIIVPSSRPEFACSKSTIKTINKPERRQWLHTLF